MSQTAPQTTAGPMPMSSVPVRSGAATLFAGPGAMRAACRAYDWAASPLGPVESWPVSLRVAAQQVLAFGTPAVLVWGPQFVVLFNDAQRPGLGSDDDARAALGGSAPLVWPGTWRADDVRQIMAGGPPALHTDVRHTMVGAGRTEDTWWTYTDSPLFGDDGAIHGVLTLCEETTARVLGEQRLLASEIATQQADRRAARILDQMADEHLTMDADFRIQSLNAAAERGLGVSRADLVGRTYWEVFPQSVGSQLEIEYRRAMQERVAVHVAEHYTGNGSARHLEIEAYPTDDGGIALFSRDVSERVRADAALAISEERLRLAVEQTGLAWWDLDVAAGRLLWSSTHFSMLGLLPTPDGAATVDTWSDRLHPEDRDRALATLASAERESTSYHESYRIVRADNGETR